MRQPMVNRLRRQASVNRHAKLYAANGYAYIPPPTPPPLSPASARDTRVSSQPLCRVEQPRTGTIIQQPTAVDSQRSTADNPTCWTNASDRLERALGHHDRRYPTRRPTWRVVNHARLVPPGSSECKVTTPALPGPSFPTLPPSSFRPASFRFPSS